MPRLLSLTAALLLVACGARSELLSSDDGATNTSSTATGGGGAGGGTGGGGSGAGAGPADCSTLALDGPVGVAGGEMAHQRQPALVAIDDSLVAMALEWTDASFPDAPQEARHNAFSPWGTFPTSALGPTFVADPERGGTLRATSAPNGSLALLMSATKGPGQHLGFRRFYTNGDGPSSNGVGFGQVDESAFAEHDGNGRFLVGWSRGLGLWEGLRAAVIATDPDNGQLSIAAPPQPLACASQLATGDASFNGEGWVVAVSTAKPTMECEQPPAPTGPPELVQSLFITPEGTILPTGVVSTVAVDRVAVVGVEGGHYAFWTGAGDSFGGPLYTQRMNQGGDPEGEPFALPGLDDAVVGGLWSVGRFGDGFLLTWRSGADGAVHARRFDADASPLAEITLPGDMAGRPDVLGDPSGAPAALVAFPVAGGSAEQMQLHRVRCPAP